MADLATLLAQTEATLFAAFDLRASVAAQIEAAAGRLTETAQLHAARDRGRESAAKEARRIVTEVFGPPCGFYRAAGRSPQVHGLAPVAPHDECSQCPWPRSEHGQAQR